MELDSPGAAASQTGEVGHHPDRPILAVGSMVPVSTGYVGLLTDSDSEIQCASPSRKRNSYPSQEPPLALRGLEGKRTRLMREWVSEQAIVFINNNNTAVKTYQRYEAAQKEFTQWLRDGSFEQGVYPAVIVVNWLHHTMATKKLQWSSVLNRKAAVLALFHDPEAITRDPIFKAFLMAGHSLGVVDTKHEIYSIEPVLAFFKSKPDNHTLPMMDLAKKLAWLLGVCGFMRPDDIVCTDVAKSGVIGDKLQLAVVFPKEKRGKQRIIKYVHLSRHTDLAICPVHAYTTYRSRTMFMDVPARRTSRFYAISVYMNTISRLFVPKGTRPPKLRALGSTLAAMAGVPIPDIMVQGNWSSPKIFEKHYRLSSVISNNLSVSTLGIPLEPHMDMAP
ncbi:hypothetical protein BGZ96_004875 [Linnemannia gamsii]|uniref:Tyr recombinase domain-containing protein n=1 Tax=Linnemannia gamsii TaxID=64522 RepID=A0ABQ7JHQ2_9FUNG|nr:hypothetical protein BGZ96_004875 [Linnemannia gamsii]